MNEEQLYYKFIGQTAKQIQESSNVPDDLMTMSLYQEDAAILTKVVLRNGQIAQLGWASKYDANDYQ